MSAAAAATSIFALLPAGGPSPDVALAIRVFATHVATYAAGHNDPTNVTEAYENLCSQIALAVASARSAEAAEWQRLQSQWLNEGDGSYRP